MVASYKRCASVRNQREAAIHEQHAAALATAVADAEREGLDSCTEDAAVDRDEIEAEHRCQTTKT